LKTLQTLAWAGAGVLGGLIGAAAAVLLTELIKLSLAGTAMLGSPWLRLLPLLGVALAVLILFGLGRGQPLQTIAPREDPRAPASGSPASWYSFPHDIARADLTGDVVSTAGAEERFPWHLAPLRSLAILATVGLGRRWAPNLRRPTSAWPAAAGWAAPCRGCAPWPAPWRSAEAPPAFRR